MQLTRFCSRIRFLLPVCAAKLTLEQVVQLVVTADICHLLIVSPFHINTITKKKFGCSEKIAIIPYTHPIPTEATHGLIKKLIVRPKLKQ